MYRDSPDQYVVDNKTKYVIVEEIMYNVLEGDYKKRSIYSLENKNSNNISVNHSFNYPEENSIMGMKTIQFVYKK